MKYGFTPDGLKTPSFQDIQESYKSAFLKSLGNPLNFDEGAVLGTLVGIFAEAEALIWEQVVKLYSGFNPDTASTFMLDAISDYSNISRLEPTATTVMAELKAANQTNIPAGSLVSATGVPTVFKLDADILCSNASCYSIEIKVANIDNPNFLLTVNGHQIEYEKQGLDTEGNVLDALANRINEANIGATAVSLNNILTITGTYTKNLTATYISEELEVISVTNLGKFTAQDKGDISLPAKVLTHIVTPIAGWISVYNALAGDTGRDMETDLDLRIRRNESLAKGGSGTIDAIRANVLNVAGVVSVDIKENDTNEEVNGLPPHSYEVLILGASDDNKSEIANAMWKSRPAGIEPIGNETVNVTDTSGKTQAIKFTKPIKYYVTIRIQYQTEDNEELLATEQTAIKKAIVAQFKDMKVGDDVIYQSFYKSIYSISGIKSATISIGATLDPNQVPELNTQNIEVQSPNVAVTDESKITLVKV